MPVMNVRGRIKFLKWKVPITLKQPIVTIINLRGRLVGREMDIDKVKIYKL